MGNRPKVVGGLLQSFCDGSTWSCDGVRQPCRLVIRKQQEAATTRLLPGKNDALPSDDGHDTAVVASAAVAVRMHCRRRGGHLLAPPGDC